MAVEDSGITEREPERIANWMKDTPEHQEELKKQNERTDKKFEEFMKSLKDE